MTTEARAATLTAARDAGFGRKELQRMSRRSLGDPGDLALHEADVLAKGFGLDSTRKLLYDLSDRSQFFDVTRLIFPFGEAFKEILTTWARIGITEGGGVPLRRGQQIIEGARGAGFFYTDPQSEEEVFAYPGSAWLMDKVAGVPFPLTGAVSGLNLIGATVLPGVGPVVQIPMSKLLPNKPEWDWVREVVLPFGDPDFSQGVLESQLPAWARKLRTWLGDPESDRALGNTTGDVMRWLMQTRDYSMATPEEQQRLYEDAGAIAKKMFLVRGAAQFIVPSAPRFAPLAKDEDGRTVAAQLLMDDFRQMQERDYDTAVFAFLDKYGPDALLFMQPKSRASVGGLPTSGAGTDWLREHPEVAEKFPLVYGFFAPQGEDFDLTAYSRQFDTGEREKLTPEQMTKLANSRVAGTIYAQARQTAGGSKAGQTWLRQVREALTSEYPGFRETLRLAEKATVGEVVAQFGQAVTDPVVARTDAGKGVALYLQARDKAMESAKAAGLAGFGSAAKAQGIRVWLRQVAEAIKVEHPDFARVFDESLEREFVADDEVAA